MNKFEIFDNEFQVLRRIDKLRIEDINDENIVVIYKDGFEHQTLRYSNVNFKKSNGNLWDRLMARIGDNTGEDRVFNSLNLTSEESKRYQEIVENGAFLLFVSGVNIENLPSEEDSYVSSTDDDAETYETAGTAVDMSAEEETPPLPDSEVPELPSNNRQAESTDGAVIDMRTYVTSPPLEAEDDDDSSDESQEKDDTDKDDKEDNVEEEAHKAPKNPDYTVKDNVVDLSGK